LVQEWLARHEEIIDNYEPDIVYFDIGVNPRKLDPIKLRFVAYYYNSAAGWGRLDQHQVRRVPLWHNHRL